MTSDQSTVSTFPEHAEGFRPLDPDTLVRVTQRSSCGDSDLDNQAASTTIEYVVEGFSFGPDGDDPNGRAYYLLDIPDHSFGGNYWAYPEHIEAASTPQQRAEARQEARASLTPAMLVQEVTSAAMSLSDLNINEVDWSAGDGTATISGRTNEGVEFTATVTVSNVEVGY